MALKGQLGLHVRENAITNMKRGLAKSINGQRKAFNNVSNNLSFKGTQTQAKPACSKSLVKQPAPISKSCEVKSTCGVLKKEQKSCQNKENSGDFIDIDKDKPNPSFVSIYANDIFSYLKKLELETPIEFNHLKYQIITGNARAEMVEWMHTVATSYQLQDETLQQAVCINDRYLQKEKGFKKEHCELLCLCSLYTASQYEELIPFDMSDIIYMGGGAWSRKEIVQTQVKVLGILEYKLGRPVYITFLRRFSTAADASSLQHNCAKYLTEIALLEYTLAHERPSVVAAAATFIAACIQKGKISSNHWTPTLAHYSGYKLKDIKGVVAKMSRAAIKFSSSKFESMRNKYASAKNYCVSLHPLMLSESNVLRPLSKFEFLPA